MKWKQYLCMALAGTMIIILAGCENNEKVAGSGEKQNSIGIDTDGVMPIDLNVSEIEDNTIPEHPELNIEVVQKLNCLDAISDAVTEDETFALYGSKKYYISTLPIYHFNVTDYRYSDVVSYLIFDDSNDISKVSVLDLLIEDKEFVSWTLNYTINPGIMDAFEANQDMSFILVWNGDNELLLAEDNALHNNRGNYDIKVKGDYFHAIYNDKSVLRYNDLLNYDSCLEISAE